MFRLIFLLVCAGVLDLPVWGADRSIDFRSLVLSSSMSRKVKVKSARLNDRKTRDVEVCNYLKQTYHKLQLKGGRNKITFYFEEDEKAVLNLEKWYDDAEMGSPKTVDELVEYNQKLPAEKRKELPKMYTLNMRAFMGRSFDGKRSFTFLWVPALGEKGGFPYQILMIPDHKSQSPPGSISLVNLTDKKLKFIAGEESQAIKGKSVAIINELRRASKEALPVKMQIWEESPSSKKSGWRFFYEGKWELGRITRKFYVVFQTPGRRKTSLPKTHLKGFVEAIGTYKGSNH